LKIAFCMPPTKIVRGRERPTSTPGAALAGRKLKLCGTSTIKPFHRGERRAPESITAIGPVTASAGTVVTARVACAASTGASASSAVPRAP
jgi:hypothetical protein